MKEKLARAKAQGKVWLNRIDWASKLVDLLIVITGITIAFQLSSWGNSSRELERKQAYLLSFQQENTDNQELLALALAEAGRLKQGVDTLEALLSSGRYNDPRLGRLSGRLTTTAYYRPLTLTMDIVKQSGDLNLFTDLDFRQASVQAYTTLSRAKAFDQDLRDYVDKTIEPYYFSSVNYLTFQPVNGREFVSDLSYINIVASYRMALASQLERYRRTLETLQEFEQAIVRQQHALH